LQKPIMIHSHEVEWLCKKPSNFLLKGYFGLVKATRPLSDRDRGMRELLGCSISI